MTSVDITVVYDAIREYVNYMALALAPIGLIAFGFAFGNHLMWWVQKKLRAVLVSDLRSSVLSAPQLPPTPEPYLQSAVSDDDDWDVSYDDPLEITVPLTRTHCIYCGRKLENFRCPGCGAPND